MKKEIRKLLDQKQSKGLPKPKLSKEQKTEYYETRKKKLVMPDFNHRIVKTTIIGPRKILELACGHLVEDKTDRNISSRRFCPICVNEFLQKELHAINSHFNKFYNK
jgi:hypothetical protein